MLGPKEPSASKLSTTLPSLPSEARVGAKPCWASAMGTHGTEGASFTPPFGALVVADNEVASRIPVTYSRAA